MTETIVGSQAGSGDKNWHNLKGVAQCKGSSAQCHPISVITLVIVTGLLPKICQRVGETLQTNQYYTVTHFLCGT